MSHGANPPQGGRSGQPPERDYEDFTGNPDLDQIQPRRRGAGQPPERREGERINTPRNNDNRDVQQEIDLSNIDGYNALPAGEKVDAIRDVYKELGKARNISFTITQDEMQKIIFSPEEAKKVIEGWLAAIESNEQHYSSEGTNRVTLGKLEATLNWLRSVKYAVNKKDDGGKRNDKETLAYIEEVIEEAESRKGIHDVRKAIASSDWDKLPHFIDEFGARRMLLGFKTKNAVVAFNTYQRFFDRYLYNYGKVTADKHDKPLANAGTGIYKVRVTPELITQYIRPAVAEELKRNWQLYGFANEAEAADAERIGYGVFTVSQRKAVQVARGHINNEYKLSDKKEDDYYRKPLNNPAFLSDPDEMLTNLYSPLEMQFIKWSRPSDNQWKLLNSIMGFMGKGDLQVGEQLFNDALSIADFCSSGWRMSKTLEAMKTRMIMTKDPSEEQAKLDYRLNSLALGMRLKSVDISLKPVYTAEDLAKIDTKVKDALRQVARFKPLEMIKEYAEQIDRHGRQKHVTKRQEQFEQMFQNGEFRLPDGTIVKHYVELEEILGKYIYPIYERGYRKNLTDKQRDWTVMRGIDIGTAGTANSTNPFAVEDQAIIEEVVREVNSKSGVKDALTVEQFKSMYKKLQDFALNEATLDDFNNGRDVSGNRNGMHSYFFSRTMFVDDIPFDLMEEDLKDEKGVVVDIALSKKYNDISQGGRDAYKRIWNDTSAGSQASEAFIGGSVFATDADKLVENLVKGALAMNNYAGKGPAMKFVYGVIGGWLKMAKADALYGSLGLANKLPIPTSEMERLFGEGAPSMTREDMHHFTEKLKLIWGDMEHEFPDVGELEIEMKKGAGLSPLMIWMSRYKSLFFVILMALVSKMMEQSEKDSEE